MTFWRTVVVTEEPRFALHAVQIFGYGTGEVPVLKGSGTPDRQTWGATHWPVPVFFSRTSCLRGRR